jgi:ABC-type taurine transport system substrate-binding protein
MIFRLTIFSVSIFILTTQAACQNSTSNTSSIKQSDTTKHATDNFFKQIMLLDEFNQEQKRVDSIKKVSGVPVEVSVDIVDSSFLKEDEGKSISLAFINEKYPYDNRIMYTIKFDKNKQKIISVDKDKKQFEKSDLAKPEDIVLPNKN